MYGWGKAYDDANNRGVSNPSAYTWWLDVETDTTWSGNTSSNRADLEGMAAYFGSINATTGLYSTTPQWSQLVGSVPATNPLSKLESWLAGAKTATTAKRNCSARPLTGGGRVTLTQYVSGGLDDDTSCI